MCDNNNNVLDQIAEEIGEITEEQEDDESDDSLAREGEEFDDEDYRRNKNDYHGDW